MMVAELAKPPGLVRIAFLMAVPTTYAASSVRRTPPALPFGWGAVTVLLVGAVFLIIGIVIVIYAFFNLITGVLSAATGPSAGVLGIFQTFMGALILFVMGGVLAGIGGWLVRLWWIFLLVGVVVGTAGNTARERETIRTSEVRVRCQSCGRLNPEFVKFCMSCNKPV